MPENSEIFDEITRNPRKAIVNNNLMTKQEKSQDSLQDSQLMSKVTNDLSNIRRKVVENNNTIPIQENSQLESKVLNEMTNIRRKAIVNTNLIQITENSQLQSQLTMKSNEETIESNEQTIESKEQTIESNEPTIESNEPTIESNEQTIESNEPTIKSILLPENTQIFDEISNNLNLNRRNAIANNNLITKELQENSQLQSHFMIESNGQTVESTFDEITKNRRKAIPTNIAVLPQQSQSEPQSTSVEVIIRKSRKHQFKQPNTLKLITETVTIPN